MRRRFDRHRNKNKRMVGTALSIIGLLIIINIMSMRFLLLLIGVALVLMGGLLYIK
ncbi:MAG TPA: hypothetical protein VK087_05135 [Tissierellaceae bacterium]|nr:hypothetical protein [Tissierellaceae bacterium]